MAAVEASILTFFDLRLKSTLIFVQRITKVVAFGEKSNKSIQIFQIFFLFV